MRSLVLCVLIHLVHIYGFEELDCSSTQLLVNERSCNSGDTELTMHALPESIHKINLTEYTPTNTGCLIESHGQIGNNNTFYMECETEDIDCEENEDVRKVFVVECEGITLNLTKQIAEAEESGAKDKNLTMPILVGSTAAACGAVGLGFLAYKLKTLLQSGSYLIPA